MMLTDRCARDGGPLKVDVYADPRTRRSYQVDKEAGAYREADFSQGPATYGEWKKLDAE
ncbi:MAG TPA: hypothetical protein VE153_16655 [Myxococcus sp.]|nr:hypothetical protein [Myxococcus sp.]